MPPPALTWRTYDVGAGEGIATAAGGATVDLPDLGAWPAPLDKARILLESAAEIEHALMVQYLYAVYSLKSADEVGDPGQQAVLDETSPTSWGQVLLGIAREEMGHLMTVQNLLLAIGLPPNLEREDFPPRKDLYPFPLHLEALSQHSLAKYVVAEAATGAEGIEDIVAVAQAAAGATVNRVGVLYGLLGLVFTRAADLAAGVSGSPEWDDMLRHLAEAAYQQAPADAWHLPDTALAGAATAVQADPDDWQAGGLRVHRIADRDGAVQAIRDVGEQGEGPTQAAEESHFARLLAMYRGTPGTPAFPDPSQWAPTRDVPTDPAQPPGFDDPSARAWAQLADQRYGLLLGFIEHYLLSTGDRALLTAWIFAEMRSALGPISRALTAMPRGGGAGAAAAQFTLPDPLHLPAAEPARWELHGDRTRAAIATAEGLQAAGPPDRASADLESMLASDRARLELMSGRGPAGTENPGFARDIRPLFRPKDVAHMADIGVDLTSYEAVRDGAAAIARRLASGGRRMPPPPDPPWTTAQLDVFARWTANGSPP